jgi:flagellar biosynthesis/type III secretory pathway protein FliH
MQKGMQQGIQEGMQKGIQEGMQQGIEQGRQMGKEMVAQKIVLNLIHAFPELADSKIAELSGVTEAFVQAVRSKK